MFKLCFSHFLFVIVFTEGDLATVKMLIINSEFKVNCNAIEKTINATTLQEHKYDIKYLLCSANNFINPIFLIFQS